MGGLELRLTDLEEGSLPSGKKAERFLASHGPLTSSLLVRDDAKDGQQSVSKNDYSMGSPSSGRSKGNPLLSHLMKPWSVGANRLGVSGGSDVNLMGLPMQYLVRSGDAADSVTSLDGDESTLAGGGGNIGTDLSLTSMDLSELEGKGLHVST